MIKVVKSDKVDKVIDLSYGDIIEFSDETFYFVSCDGYGKYYFVNLSDEGFILAKNLHELYKVSASLSVVIGEKLFDSLSITVVNVYKREHVDIKVNLIKQ